MESRRSEGDQILIGIKAPLLGHILMRQPDRGLPPEGKLHVDRLSEAKWGDEGEIPPRGALIAEDDAPQHPI